MAVELGAGYVSLTVEARNVAREISNQIIGPVERAMAALGRESGQRFSNEFADQTRRGLSGINLGSNLDTGFGRLGTDAGNDFARQFNQETRKLGDNTSSSFIAHTRGIGDHGSTSGDHFSRGFAASAVASFGGLAKKLGVLLTVGIGAGAGLLIGSGIVKDAVNMASGINEALTKVNVVFGESAGVIVDWSKTSATALGISQLEALDAAGTLGNLFRAMGITTDTASGMSTKMVELATDLGSFNNVSAEDALIAIKSGLVGETEPLRAFGSNLNDARIKAEAFRLGLVEAQVDQLAFSRAQETADKAARKMAATLTKNGEGSIEYADAVRDAEQASAKLSEILDGKISDSLTAAQKAQAAYSLILADTSLAQGDFGKTSGGLANQQKILGAEFDNLKAKIGTALLPSALKLVVALRTHVLPAVERWAVVFERDVIPALGRAASWIQDNVLPVLKRFAGFIRDDVIPALGDAADWIDINVIPVLERFAGFIREKVIPALGVAADWIKANVVPVLERFAGFIREKVIPAIGEFIGWLGPRLLPAIQGLRDQFNDALPKLERFWTMIQDDVIPRVRDLWELFQRDVLPTLKDVADWVLTKLIPAFQDASIVMSDIMLPVIGFIIDKFGLFIDIQIRLWNTLKETGAAVVTFVTTAKAHIEDFISALLGLPERIKNAAAGMWGPIKESFRAMLNSIIGWWNSLEFNLPAINIAGKRIGGQTINPPDIATLATGGVITRPTLAMVGETSRATPEIVAPQRIMAETFRDELRRFSPMSNMAPVRIEHFHSTEPSRTVLEEMQWRIATGVL